MKRVLSIIAGVVAGYAITFIGGAVVDAIHPMPLGFNYMDKAMMVEYISRIPQFVLVLMAFFWLLSAFTGGMVTAAIQKIHWRQPVMITSAILLAAQLLNLIMTAPSHPLWMWIVALGAYLPFSLLGGWLVRRGKTVNP
jgi:hypothetical protein